MDTTQVVSMGDRGRLVIPRNVRLSQEWDQGTRLLIIESSRGVVLATREQALALLRRQLSGASLVDELIAERRQEAMLEVKG